MKIYVCSFGAFEAWDWRNPDTQGIGGSETAAIELARRLAKRGHDVTSYAPVPPDCTDDPNDGFPVKWRHWHELLADPNGTKDIWDPAIRFNLTAPGHWIIFRQPSIGDSISKDPAIRGQQTHDLVCEDVVYYNADKSCAFDEPRCAAFDRIWALCPTHAQYLAELADTIEAPSLRQKLCITSNGIETDRIRQAFPIAFEQSDRPQPVGGWAEKRNPMRLIWASSPDRGLEALLHIFGRAVEFEPALELHCFYGFDNWDKAIGGAQVQSGHCFNEATRAWKAREVFDKKTGEEYGELPLRVSLEEFQQARPDAQYKLPMIYGHYASPMEKMKRTIVDLVYKTPNVKWHGRINQPRLREEYALSGLFVYPTWFSETSCISVMYAQALGAIPISARFWAVGHNVQYGTFVDGDPMKDQMSRARYVQAILSYVRQPEWAEAIRSEMMSWSRAHFSWDNQMVRHAEAWLSGAPSNVMSRDQLLEREWPATPESDPKQEPVLAEVPHAG